MSDMRIGLGYDVHAFGGDDALVIGGVVIRDAPGLEGHSDADVLVHAVADALLGAVGLPDLGTLFPASDEKYRGASSMDLLSDVMQRVTSEGWSVVNVDAVIAAERPNLAAHLNAMMLNLSDAVAAPVNVKPKRGEGVGAIGRGEGIAVWAVALLSVRESRPSD